MDSFNLDSNNLLDLGSMELFGEIENHTNSPISGVPLSSGTPTGMSSFQGEFFGMEEYSSGVKKEDSANFESSDMSDLFGSHDGVSSVPLNSSSANTASSETMKQPSQMKTSPENAKSNSNVAQSTARPHIPPPADLNYTTMSRSPQMQNQPGFDEYSKEISAIRMHLQRNPDAIPPPPQVIHAGQQYMVMAARMAPVNQHQLMYQQAMLRAQQMNGQMMPPNYYPMNADRQRQIAQQQHMAQQQQMQRHRRPPTPGGNAWQSEADIPLRRKMIAKIVSLLQQRKPNAPTEWIVKLPDMARRLEDSLYRLGTSRNEYGNFGTLKERLQQLAISMGAKAANRNRPGAQPQMPVQMQRQQSMYRPPTSPYPTQQQYQPYQYAMNAPSPRSTIPGQNPHQGHLQHPLMQQGHTPAPMQSHSPAPMQSHSPAPMQSHSPAPFQPGQSPGPMQPSHSPGPFQQGHSPGPMQQGHSPAPTQQGSSPAQAPSQPPSPKQKNTPNLSLPTAQQSMPSSTNRNLEDLDSVNDTDFLNFDLSPTMGGALDFDKSIEESSLIDSASESKESFFNLSSDKSPQRSDNP